LKWGNLESGGLKIRDHKQRGEWAELRFMAKAIEHGYRLTKPLGGGSPYDVVVDLGGRFMSVQVKSTMYLRRRREHQRDGCFSVTVRHRSRRPYGPFDFQYLAAYVIPRDVWYIIPFALVVGRKVILLRPDDPPGNGYERFREAWHLLREVPPAIKPWNPPVKLERYRLKAGSVGVEKGRRNRTAEPGV
jgi:hypothetical protein